MADEILTEGKGQLRGLFVTGGNPLITMANAQRLRGAFSKLELLVCLDIHESETASLAHYVLPCTSPFQRPDLPFIFPLMLGLQSKPYLQATKRLVRPTGEQLDEATIYTLLAKHSGVGLFGSKVLQKALELSMRFYAKKHPDELPQVQQEGVLNIILRATGQQGFDALLKHPHGWERKGHVAQNFLGKRVVTDDGRVHLAPAPLLAQAAKLEGDFALEKTMEGKLKLITKRAITTHNSWTHNFDEFVRGDNDTNYLYMNPEDAERLSLANGDVADVTSRTGTVRVPVRVLAELMPGTCALPHGWGHQFAKGQSVASRTSGVNVNILAADGPDQIEKLTGMAHLTGIPVDVKRASGPRETRSWSGIASEI